MVAKYDVVTRMQYCNESFHFNSLLYASKSLGRMKYAIARGQGIQCF